MKERLLALRADLRGLFAPAQPPFDGPARGVRRLGIGLAVVIGIVGMLVILGSVMVGLAIMSLFRSSLDASDAFLLLFEVIAAVVGLALLIVAGLWPLARWRRRVDVQGVGAWARAVGVVLIVVGAAGVPVFLWVAAAPWTEVVHLLAAFGGLLAVPWLILAGIPLARG